MPRILIVDDDEPFRLAMRNAVARRGYEVTLAANADEAIAALTKAPDYAVVDLRMPGPSGLEVVRSLRALPNPPQVVVLTGYGTIGTAVEAIRLEYLARGIEDQRALQVADGLLSGRFSLLGHCVLIYHP